MTSLKYWLDDPFSTRTSSSLSRTGCAEDEVLEFLEIFVPNTDESPSLLLARDFSRLKMREAMSTMMVCFSRRMRRGG